MQIYIYVVYIYIHIYIYNGKYDTVMCACICTATSQAYCITYSIDCRFQLRQSSRQHSVSLPNMVIIFYLPVDTPSRLSIFFLLFPYCYQSVHREFIFHTCKIPALAGIALTTLALSVQLFDHQNTEHLYIECVHQGNYIKIQKIANIILPVNVLVRILQ